MSKWLSITEDDGDHVHVLPLDDLVSHTQDDDAACTCGPATTPVHRDDGSIGWVFTHHSIDGREVPKSDIRGGG